MHSTRAFSKSLCAFSIFVCAANLIAQEKPRESKAQAPSSLIPNTAVQALPTGRVVFDGIHFKASLNNITGTRSARAGGSYSGAISTTPFGKSGPKIHVLHTADHGVSEANEFIWRLVLRYRNGEQRFFDFAYGVHILNLWRRPGEAVTEISDPDSAITWTGHSVESDRRGAELQIFRSTLRNPLPEEEVVGIDYITMFGASSAYVFGVSITDEGPEPRSRDEKYETGRSAAFTLINKSGEGLPDASLKFEARADDFIIRFSELRCDRHGRLELPLPRLPIILLRYSARNGSGSTFPGTIEFHGGNREPREETIVFSEK